MDALELLRIQAAEKRDKAIRTARIEYRVAIQEINTIKRKLKLGALGRPRLAAHVRKLANINDSFHGMTAAAAALAILAEGTPISLTKEGAGTVGVSTFFEFRVLVTSIEHIIAVVVEEEPHGTIGKSMRIGELCIVDGRRARRRRLKRDKVRGRAGSTPWTDEA
jgi:hypothetical protein